MKQYEKKRWEEGETRKRCEQQRLGDEVRKREEFTEA